MQPDDKRILYRIIPAGLLFVGWFVLVLLNKTDVGPFIGAVQAALIGMGIYHTTRSTPGDMSPEQRNETVSRKDKP